MNMIDNDRATRPQQFEILYQTLVDYNERFVKASMSVTTAILVVIGWLLTSLTAQGIFSDSLAATVAALLVIAVLVWVYSASMCRVYDVNRKVHEKLLALEYVDEDFFNHHRLPRNYKHFGLWVNTGLYLMLALLVANKQWCIF